jgi:uncharacterized protein (DUF58 family)
VPSRRLLLAFGLLAAAAAVSVLVPGLRAAVLAGDLALAVAGLLDAAAARRCVISARRVRPPLLVQEEPAEAMVELAAPGARRNIHVRLREGLSAAVSAEPRRATLEILPGRTTVWRYRLEPRRRGEHRLLPLTARIEGPWRLAWVQRELLAPETVRVYPRIRWEGRAGWLLALAHRRQLGFSPTAQVGTGTEPYGVRRYSEGDARNRIHWKATARHRRLMVREETWEKSGRLIVLLDCGRSMASLDGRRSKLDAAVASALALARVASARGDQVLLVAFSDRVERRVRIRTGSRGIARAYASLYDLEARLTESAYDVAAEAARDSEFRRARVLLMTSLVDLAGAQLLRDALRSLSRQHRPLFVHLEDPDIARLAGAVPATVLDAYAKVSALEILLGNRALSARLRHAGIETVSTSSERLTLDTLDLYLASLRGGAHGRRPSAFTSVRSPAGGAALPSAASGL